jgi:hypothetical protein
MTHQSSIRLFILLALMSTTLFVQQTVKLDQLRKEPPQVAHITPLPFDENRAINSRNDFVLATRNFKSAIETRRNTGIVRKIIEFLKSPLNWVLAAFGIAVDAAIDSLTDIEDEAETMKSTASVAIDQYDGLMHKAMMKNGEYQKALDGAQVLLERIQQQKISQTLSLRNLAILGFLFSLAAAIFSKPSRISVTAEWLPAERPAALKQAVGLSALGGLMSSLPELGGVLLQLALPAVYFGYFIIRRQLPDGGMRDWKRLVVGGLGFALLAAVVLLIAYGLNEMLITFAVSGGLLGLFLASAVEYAGLSLTTAQFFSLGLVFAFARTLAALGAAWAGAELAVLEGLVGIFLALWVMQVQARWLIAFASFDVLLAWVAVYSATTFGMGNFLHFHGTFMELAGSHSVLALLGGGLLSWQLSKARMEGNLQASLIAHETLPAHNLSVFK